MDRKKHHRGEIQGMQKALIGVIRARFPHLTELAQQKTKHIKKVSALELLIGQMAGIPDETTARVILDTIPSYSADAFER